jgi:thiol-disulfide isomerase/thioredoxin
MFVKDVAIALALTMTLAGSASGAPANPAPPKGFEQLQDRFLAPKTPFGDEYGTSTTIDAFKGKIVILNFWATWCAPCIKEMPSLERLAARLSAEKFAVIAVSQDKGGASIAKPFLDRIGVRSLPLYVDPNGRLSRDLSVRGLPTTVVIAGDGTVVGKLEGAAEWDANDVVAYLISLFDR